MTTNKELLICIYNGQSYYNQTKILYLKLLVKLKCVSYCLKKTWYKSKFFLLVLTIKSIVFLIKNFKTLLEM